MRRHLTETEGQQERLKQILRSMSEPTSTIKDAAMAFFGIYAL
jgi:ferritin-like metal-binding protein YciE